MDLKITKSINITRHRTIIVVHDEKSNKKKANFVSVYTQNFVGDDCNNISKIRIKIRMV